MLKKNLLILTMALTMTSMVVQPSMEVHAAGIATTQQEVSASEDADMYLPFKQVWGFNIGNSGREWKPGNEYGLNYEISEIGYDWYPTFHSTNVKEVGNYKFLELYNTIYNTYGSWEYVYGDMLFAKSPLATVGADGLLYNVGGDAGNTGFLGSEYCQDVFGKEGTYDLVVQKGHEQLAVNLWENKVLPRVKEIFIGLVRQDKVNPGPEWLVGDESVDPGISDVFHADMTYFSRIAGIAGETFAYGTVDTVRVRTQVQITGVNYTNPITWEDCHAFETCFWICDEVSGLSQYYVIYYDINGNILPII